MARVIYEKSLFPDQFTPEGINTRSYLFYGSSTFQVKITDFLQEEVFDVYPKA
jgi:hypothetical protein